MDAPKFQTLSEYLREPFGSPDTENQKKLHQKYKENSGKIKIVNGLIYENTYMVHIAIPSESQEGKSYDVVIQFLPGSKVIEKEFSLLNYYVQFFSNSPSFVYRYAVLYKNNGYMIDALQEKMDPNYADALPSKTNKEMKLTYDKSLYFACRFLEDHKEEYMVKRFYERFKHVKFQKFLDDITDYKGEKFNFDIYEIESSFKKELIKDIQDAGKHMKLTGPKERKGIGIIPKKKPISKVKPKLNTFNTTSFGGMSLKPTAKAKTASVVKKKPKVRSTAKRKG